MIDKLKFRCCFCNEGIQETNLDPLDISIVGLKKLVLGRKPSQNFYCHFTCLRSKLHNYFQGYLIEEMFSDNDDPSK